MAHVKLTPAQLLVFKQKCIDKMNELKIIDPLISGEWAYHNPHLTGDFYDEAKEEA